MNPLLKQLFFGLIFTKSHLNLAHPQDNQISYQVVYSNLEEDSLLNFQKFTKYGWLANVPKNH